MSEQNEQPEQNKQHDERRVRWNRDGLSEYRQEWLIDARWVPVENPTPPDGHTCAITYDDVTRLMQDCIIGFGVSPDSFYTDNGTFYVNNRTWPSDEDDTTDRG